MANFTENPRLGAKFEKALMTAAKLHQCQIRKTGEIPYIAHLLAVSSLVLEAGGTEDEAIAALFHDLVEDVDVQPESLIEDWGYEIYSIVLSLSENKILPKARRKAAYVEEVARTDTPHWQSVQLISAADKLHNLRSYATTGRELWKPETAAFYAELLPIYAECPRVPQHWIEELEYLLEKL